MTGEVPLGLIPGSISGCNKQRPSHMIILMIASCHEQHHAALMTNTFDLQACPTRLFMHHWTHYGTVEYNSLHNGHSCPSWLGLFFSGPVSLAWRPAFCLCECLLKLLMRDLSAGWRHSCGVLRVYSIKAKE